MRAESVPELVRMYDFLAGIKDPASTSGEFAVSREVIED
jgi:hypothetical protein